MPALVDHAPEDGVNPFRIRVRRDRALHRRKNRPVYAELIVGANLQVVQWVSGRWRIKDQRQANVTLSAPW